MRRLIIEEPVSRAAIWGRRIALFSVPVFAAGVVLTRRGNDLTASLAVTWAGALLALVAVAFAIVAFVQIWREGRRGIEASVQTLLLAAAVLALPLFLVARLVWTPYYADLTTDTARPPAFSRSAAAFAARGGPAPQAAQHNILTTAVFADGQQPSTAPAATGADETGAADQPGRVGSAIDGSDIDSATLTDLTTWTELTTWTGRATATALATWTGLVESLPLPVTDTPTLREMQRRAHPEFRSLQTDLSAEEAFSRVEAAAAGEGWTVVDRLPPGGRFGVGHLDAVSSSSLLRLPVDLTVRLQIHAEGTTIDVRSIPRYRLFDVGTGPRRIERFMQAVGGGP